jgi:hypothetical protein
MKQSMCTESINLFSLFSLICNSFKRVSWDGTVFLSSVFVLCRLMEQMPHIFPSHSFFTLPDHPSLLVVDHPMGLFLLNFNSNALLGIVVQSILFKYPNHCSHFSFIFIDKFCIPQLK